MATEENLKSGFHEFFYGGIDEEGKERFKLAVTAYFKAITQLCDLLILRKRGFAPTSHSERFRVLERSFPAIYGSVDKIFKTYLDTYQIPITIESCSVVKNEIKQIIHHGRLAEDFKEALAKIQGKNS
ncbi:hypothetical protein HYV84_02715 [Candidatus Woesearchaeota archaeon]|nr:hypothetical protein [Candidatus Woesearchaeota archaeon]